MGKVKKIVKAGKTVATIIGKMVVKGDGGLGREGYIGQIKNQIKKK